MLLTLDGVGSLESMAEGGPDLSHLTPKERLIIESVMMRHQQEEQKEHEIMRRKQDEVEVLEETIRQRNEQHKKAGMEMEATCNICLKTKFADGVGHVCNYCSIRCCARCGGKVTLRSTKVIWVCILCRKKQELLSKTGQWINKGMAGSGDPVMRRIEADMAAGGLMAHDKRPKLERAHSAAEKENQPIARPGVRRQFSQQDQQAREEEMRYYRGEIEGLMRQQCAPPPEYRTDSFSSEQSSMDCGPSGPGRSVPPQPGASKKHKRSGSTKKPHAHHLHQHHLDPRTAPVQPQRSFSSSDDELRSTSECSCDEHDVHEKVVTERRDGPSALIERRRKKTVRFDGHGTKDSGIGTSSEDSNSAPKYPHSWQESPDGGHIIGHMILKKNTRESGHASSANILGLKVVGGKLLETGGRGALIDKVKKGSIADVEGQLRPGDEVLEWNGRSLKGKSFQEVYDIIAESKQEPQVELIVSRILGSRTSRRAYVHPSKELYDMRKDKPSVLVTSPGSPDMHGHHNPRLRGQRVPSAANTNVGGRIQVKLWFDTGALQLVVTLVCAAGLMPRSNGSPRNPYAKLFLLPDRSEKSKRRTKTLANTNDPKWNQSFVYTSVRRADLKLRYVEITVWDYVRYGANDFLGEVIIELGVALLDNEAGWYHLCAHDEVRLPHGMDIERDLDLALTPTDHLSPSTTFNVSDSDPSDPDDPRERRVADGASISSVGSSNSPPPDVEMSEKGRRSRRDMSPQRKGMIPFKDPMIDVHRKVPINQRSHSAAPTDSPSLHGRSRSKSPHRSLSPPDYRIQTGVILPSHAYVPRFGSRSATATPITSPKTKRQLPQIPHTIHHYRDRPSHVDLDDRSLHLKQRGRHPSQRGWNRYHNITGVSDSDLSHPHPHDGRRRSPDKDPGDPCDSDMESVASVTSSAFSTQSERPRASTRVFSDYGGPSSGQSLGEPQTKRAPFSRSLSNADVPADERGDVSDHVPPASDGSLSDTALGRQHVGGSRRKTPSGGSSGKSQSSGMGKKSNSTSQLSSTGRKRRLGFGTKGKSSFTVHRSEEVLPDDIRHLVKQGSSVSSDGEGSQDGDSWAPSLKGSDGGQLSDFIDGLGPGQLVGRQVLGAPSLGDIQLSMCYQKGYLEVEVIRARGLQAKANCKVLPAPYVKVYLVNGKKCLAKAKTATARRTLDPLYQQQLTFRGPFNNCILQVTVWGDYGRIEGKKVFMGIAQIMLDDLNLQNIAIGWYKLFGTSSL